MADYLPSAEGFQPLTCIQSIDAASRYDREIRDRVGLLRPAQQERITDVRRERDGRLAGALSNSIVAWSTTPKLDGREIADRMAGKPDSERTPAKTDQERKVEGARERIRAQRKRGVVIVSGTRIDAVAAKQIFLGRGGKK